MRFGLHKGQSENLNIIEVCGADVIMLSTKSSDMTAFPSTKGLSGAPITNGKVITLEKTKGTIALEPGQR